MADEPDGALLERFAHGDREAFELLFRRFEHDVFRWALRLVRDPATAEDVVVEAFWRAYRARARFDPSRSFGAWIRRIATNVARDHLRAARARGGYATGYPPQAQAVNPASGDEGLHELVGVALGRLPPKLRVVATLALVEELPHAEIAEALDVPIGTVKSRLFRAVRALKKELASLGIQP
jgi:RNA polymerase sigma-70 factor (ECF subfamily)